jgi:hypothetical protein
MNRSVDFEWADFQVAQVDDEQSAIHNIDVMIVKIEI